MAAACRPWDTPSPDVSVVALALTMRPAWHARAACRGMASVGFLAPNSPTLDALWTCRSCPVRCECATSALDALADGVRIMGVWAGVHVPERGPRSAAVEALEAVTRG